MKYMLRALARMLIVSLVFVGFMLIPVTGSLLNTQVTMGASGKISFSAQRPKLVGTWVCTWYPWCLVHNRADDWSSTGHALFTPEMGSYDCNDPQYVEYALRKMDEAGIDFAFLDATNDYELDRAGVWITVAENIESPVKLAIWWGGSLSAVPNGITDFVQNIKNREYFDRLSYFKYLGMPVVSGYTLWDYPGTDYNNWVQAKQMHPNVSFWINGWHPSKWNPIVEGYVDAAFVFAPNYPADGGTENQVDYYNECNQIALSVKVFTLTPGFDGTVIGRSGLLHRQNGQTYIDCWNAISGLNPQPDVAMVISWNDHWEGHGIEPVVDSRSTTTAAFGQLYIELTKQYGDAWKE